MSQPTAVPQATQGLPGAPAAAAGPVRLEVNATALQFDKSELRAKAAAQVTAVLRNNDATIDHNLTFSVPLLPHGDTCTGPCTTTQTFTAPVAGRYDFFCNIHSTVLGVFIVEP